MLYRQSKNIVTRVLDDETVLIPINQTGAKVQKIYALNDTAKRVWKLLETPKSLDQIVAELADVYDSGDATAIRKDTDSLLTELTELMIVEQN